MGRIAFVFSGQGDQHPGMGREFAAMDAGKRVFDRCDSLREGTLRQCLSGTEEELREPKNTQPCLFAMEMAAAAVLEEKGVHGDAAAGFSMGEVAALTYGGAMDLEKGFRLICQRGLLMQKAAEKQDTAMAAVVKLSAERVEEICERFEALYPVNFNSPGQVSVAGKAEVMVPFFEEVKKAGGKAIPLKVKGAFHSPFMAEASEAFGDLLRESPIALPKLEVYSNVSAKPYRENPGELLAKQISSPVRWEELIKNMVASGVDTFIEIGPGKTLCNLIRRIDPAVKVCSAAEVLQEVSHAEG